MNYSDLVHDIAAKLVKLGIADTKGLRTSHGYHYSGRYLRVHKQFGLWLGVDREAWGRYGTTPIWWEAGNVELVRGPESILQAQKMVSRCESRLATDTLYIPIHLKTGVERDKVLADAVSKVKYIADKLLEKFPSG